MSDPINNKEFTHFLSFNNDDTGLLQISEPVKFDASQFKVVQADNYARDVTFMNEEVDLEFYKGLFELAGNPYSLPSGILVDKLGHGFEYLIEYYKRYGFESEIQYILERNGTEFVLGELNFEGAETDELTYFNCKVVQNTKRAIVKRRENTKIDGFSTLDIDGNTITPLQTENILLKAKPITQSSKWNKAGDDVVANAFWQVNGLTGAVLELTTGANNIYAIERSGIDDTLSYISTRTALNSFGFPNGSQTFTYLQAREDINDLTISISDFACDSRFIFNNDDGFINSVTAYSRLVIKYGANTETGDDLTTVVLQQFDYDETSTLGGGSSTPVSTYDTSFETTINLTRDQRVWIYVETYMDVDANVGTPTLLARNEARILSFITGGTIEMTGVSLSIDTVIKGVRYIDLLKQSVKSTSGLETSAPKWEDGGEFYDQFAFSGNLIRQRDDVPFYFSFSDRRENLMEVNGDCQINSDGAFVGQYDDFYANVDNGGFLLAPSEEFKSGFNERYTLNTFEFGYKTYEKDRDESNTIDSVHTDSQWSIKNAKVQNEKKISISDIRDPFAIESQRRSAISETTALEGDNKIFVVDVVPISPSERGGFTKSLIHLINDDGNLQLLNADNTFSWSLLGFGIGAPFTITSAENVGTYIVLELTDNVITLLDSGIATTDGEFLTTVDYPYTNVLYTNRTDEGFDSITGVENSEGFANLLYTIRRNMFHWESYLNTACSFTEADITNTFFQNNGELTTEFDGEGEIKENANISVDSLEAKILGTKLYTLPVIAEYDDVLELIQKYEQEATIGGYIRVQDNKGAVVKVYPKELAYTWSTKVLNIIGEERNESDFVTVQRKGDLILINETGYDSDILSEVFWIITGDYVRLRDANSVNIINLTKFDRVSVNGLTFESAVDLATALSSL